MVAQPPPGPENRSAPRRSPGAVTLALAVAAAAGCGGPPKPGPSATGFAPADLVVATPVEGDETSLVTRAVVSAALAAQAPQWADQLADDLDLANQLLVPAIGARFELKLRQTTPAATDQEAAPAAPALGAAEAGPGPQPAVHLTIELLEPLPAPTDDLHAYAPPALATRTIVVHRFDVAAERAVLAPAVAAAPEADRDQLLEARLRHKRAVIMLHALGHVLGGLDTEERGAVMGLRYHRDQKGMAGANRTAMRELLPAFASLGDDVRLRRIVLGYLESTEWAGWLAAERTASLDPLRALVQADLETAVAPPSSPEVQAQLGEIQQAGARGDAKAAKEKTDVLVAMYPADARLRLLACRLGLSAEGSASKWGMAHCERFDALAPGDPSVLLELAATFAKEGKTEEAAARLAQASERAAGLSDGATAAFASIARGYQAIGLLTLAETAAARADAESQNVIGGWAGTVRARYGLPKKSASFGVTPLLEGAYVGAVRGVLDLVYAENFAEASAQLTTALRRFPSAPGLLAAQCDLELRQKQAPKAKRSCDRALKNGPDTSWALYLRAILHLKDKRDKVAIGLLDRAVTLDPELRQAWRALAKALERRKDLKGLEALRARYQAILGAPLPE